MAPRPDALFAADRPAAGIEVALQTLQVGFEFRGGLAAEVEVLLQRLIDNLLEFEGKLVIQLHRRFRRLVKNGIEDRRRRGSFKRQLACGHFIQDRSEGKHVGAGVEFFSEGLLGRHVGHRAERRAGAG